MKYTVIHPLGIRNGKASFDCFYNDRVYKSNEQAHVANDYVIANFVEDENKIIYFEIYHTKDPDNKIYQKLYVQNFPFGVDVFDDENANIIASGLLSKWMSENKLI